MSTGHVSGDVDIPNFTACQGILSELGGLYKTNCMRIRFTYCEIKTLVHQADDTSPLDRSDNEPHNRRKYQQSPSTSRVPYLFRDIVI